ARRSRPLARGERPASVFTFAHGLALAADASRLCVCQTMGRNAVRLPIRADGALGASEPYGPVLGEPAFPRATPDQRSRFGATDGCGFDAEGNLWVTLVLANKVIAITPARDVVTVIHDRTGELLSWPTNVSWAGRDMRDPYICPVRRT